MAALRHYEYSCNGYAIRHTSYDDRYFIEHPVDDILYGIEFSLRKARKFAMSLNPLY